jgi:hypothetical protein
VFAFARSGEGLEPVIVVINVSKSERVAGTSGNLMKLISAKRRPLVAKGDQLERIAIAGMVKGTDSNAAVRVQWIDSLPQVAIRVPPESIVVYRKSQPVPNK